MNFVVCRRAQSGCSGLRSPLAVVASSVFGTTMNAQRVPVKPPFFEKLRNSIATRARRGFRRSNAARGIADVSLVSRVEEDERLVRPRVIDPRLELRARRDGAGRVVRKAEIDHVHLFRRRLGDEAVLRGALQIDEPRIRAALVALAGVAGHDVRIDIDGIDRVGDRDAVLVAEDVEDVAAIALRAVADEDLVIRDLDALRAEIILRDRVPQPLVTLLRAVAVKAFARRHLVHRLVHRARRTAPGSGSVTSPMPQRMMRLAASGFASAKRFTRRPISGKR